MNKSLKAKPYSDITMTILAGSDARQCLTLSLDRVINRFSDKLTW